MTTTPSIDQDRLVDELLHLATFSDHPAPAVTRVVFTERDREARVWLKARFAEAGLEVREDAIGNTYARWRGSDASAAPVATGSHVDAIPHAGLYDGCVGVLGGLEAIRALQRAGMRPRRSIDLIVFTSEEPTRFGIGCTGSRAMAGLLTPERLRTLKDTDGIAYDEAARGAGHVGALGDVALRPGAYHAFVELHIEQGPFLERKGLDIGAVTAIAAPASLTVEVTGQGGHAGGLLMPDRHDALCAASECVLAVEAAARGTGSVDTVGTVGILDVHPRAVNSVPSRVSFTIDCRDTDAARRDGALARMHEAFAEIAARRGVSIAPTLLNADPPATCAPALVESIETASRALGLGHRRMVSRAYHDSLFMARVAPTAMIFIPCRGGVSHRPDEYSSPQAIAAGAAVLARVLADAAG